VEFAVDIGEYNGVVRVPRRVFQSLVPERSTPTRAEAVSSGAGLRGSPRPALLYMVNNSLG
jgi:hypothetical protein